MSLFDFLWKLYSAHRKSFWNERHYFYLNFLFVFILKELFLKGGLFFAFVNGDKSFLPLNRKHLFTSKCFSLYKNKTFSFELKQVKSSKNYPLKLMARFNISPTVCVLHFNPPNFRAWQFLVTTDNTGSRAAPRLSAWIVNQSENY